MDPVVIALLSLVVGLPIAIVLTIKVWEYVYPVESILKEARRRVGRGSKNCSVKLSYRWKSGGGNSRILIFSYSLSLPDEAKALELLPEGSESGEMARGGRKELLTGLEDFDDYFWVSSCPREWLTHERAAILLELFDMHGVERVKEGALRGELQGDQAPWSARNLANKVLTLQGLVDELNSPSGKVRERPSGWVSRRKRARWTAGLGATGTLLCLVGGFGLMIPELPLYPLVFTGCLLALGCLLCLVAVRVLQGSRSAIPLGRWCTRLSILIGCLAIPLALAWHSPIMGVLLHILIAFVVYSISTALFNSLTRLPLK